MKRKIIILGMLTTILISGCSSTTVNENTNSKAETVENPDFRNCKWGMSKDEVKKYESDIEIVDESEDEIKAKVEIDNTDFLAAYYFNDDKLEQVTMVSMEEHSNENLYIDDYEDFQELITEKYGEPETDENIWSDDLYKDDTDDWGFAISLGDLIMVSRWYTDTTEVGLTLTGDNYEIAFGIIYRNINYEEEIDTSGI